jgi:drug/metabolite transporter (DMT)-like permease
MLLVALALVSAFLHALWNALLRLEPDKDRGLVGAVLVATLLATVVAAARLTASHVAPFPTAASAAWALAAGVLEWLYFASLAQALARGALGPVYTVSRGGAILAIWPLSIALFAESLALTAAIGSAVVLGGIALSGRASGDQRGLSRAALLWSITCACAIAGYHLAYKAALAAGGSSSAVFALALALASAINLARTRGTLAYVRPRLGRVVVMGLVCGSSFLLLIEALATGGAAFVLTLRNTSVLFATLLAAAIGEPPRHSQVVGAILVAGGAILMAWS